VPHRHKHRADVHAWRRTEVDGGSGESAGAAHCIIHMQPRENTFEPDHESDDMTKREMVCEGANFLLASLFPTVPL